MCKGKCTHSCCFPEEHPQGNAGKTNIAEPSDHIRIRWIVKTRDKVLPSLRRSKIAEIKFYRMYSGALSATVPRVLHRNCGDFAVSKVAVSDIPLYMVETLLGLWQQEEAQKRTARKLRKAGVHTGDDVVSYK